MALVIIFSLTVILLSQLLIINSASIDYSPKSSQSQVLTFNSLSTGQQAYSYVQVRTGANMFWWLYYAGDEDDEKSYLNYPLVLFLSGGPGDSSTGYANFAEIGPKTEKLEDRKGSWLEYANLLFIDSPVGSGFSYVTNESLLVKTDEELIDDLTVCLKTFYEKRPDFIDIPLYVFGESYGGKVAISLARKVHEKNITVNLVGVGIGNGAIDLPRSVSQWAKYLNMLGLIDLHEMRNAETTLKNDILDNFNSGKGREATLGWIKLWTELQDYTHYIDFHNILNGNKFYPGSGYEDPLVELMNEKIKPMLGIIPQNVVWNGYSGKVFDTLFSVFLNRVTDDVEYILNNTNVKIAVYNGQLDVIIPITSVEGWINDLHWKNATDFSAKNKSQISGPRGNPGAFLKRVDKFSYYTILRAGHSSPRDQLKSTTDMLTDFIKAP